MELQTAYTSNLWMLTARSAAATGLPVWRGRSVIGMDGSGLDRDGDGVACG